MVGGHFRKRSGACHLFSPADEENNAADLLGTSTNHRKPAGWRAMPYILGATISMSSF